jgi:ferritin-like metal-binding protein YciE
MERRKKGGKQISKKAKVETGKTSKLRSSARKGSTATTPNEKLLLYLNEALAMENATIERLKSRARLTTFGDLRTRIEQHLEDTSEQRKRLTQLIYKLGGTPTEDLSQLAISVSPKSILDQLQKKLPTAEVELKDIKMDAMMEYSEGILYETLIQLAEKAKNEEAVQILTQNLDEERAMIIWMRTYMSSLIGQLWQGIPAPVVVVREGES